MRQDVVELTKFYASPLGQVAHAMIARRLEPLWGDAKGLDVLGLGYATPFLERYRGSARRVVAAMPAAQGVERWPGAGRACAALVEEDTLAFRDAVFDRVLLVHMLEEAESLAGVLREVWRVTSPEARVVIVASNRRGLWSRMETSPYGHGRSFTRGQLTRVLNDALFTPCAWSRALYAPPVQWRSVLSSADAWEKAGERLWPRLGGAILVEATKHVGARTVTGRRQLVYAPARAGAVS